MDIKLDIHLGDVVTLRTRDRAEKFKIEKIMLIVGGQYARQNDNNYIILIDARNIKTNKKVYNVDSNHIIRLERATGHNE